MFYKKENNNFMVIKISYFKNLFFIYNVNIIILILNPSFLFASFIFIFLYYLFCFSRITFFVYSDIYLDSYTIYCDLIFKLH